MKLRWTRLARSDIDSAYEYIARENADAADHFLERIQLTRDAWAGYPGTRNPWYVMGRSVPGQAGVHRDTGGNSRGSQMA